MPKDKEPLERDRFRIIAHVNDLAQVGPVLAMLRRLGVEEVGYELETEVHTWTAGSTRKDYESSAYEFATETFLPNNENFRPRDLAKHFEDNGRGGATAYGVISRWVEEGLIRKSEEGTYIRKPLQLSGPVPSSQAGDSQQPTLPLESEAERKQHDTTNIVAVQKFIKKRKVVTTSQLRDLFKSQGRNDKSVSPILAKLLAKKEIRHTGTEGEYAIIANNPKPKSPQKKANGNAQPEMSEATETANG